MLPLPSRRELIRRFPRLLAGLVVLGFGFSLMIASELGLPPWVVFHEGLSIHTGIPIGTVGILVGLVVLLAWFPLRERPGVGTVTNVIVVGLTIDLSLLWLSEPEAAFLRWGALLGGVAICAVGTSLYIGAGLGPGPRDGVMTGLARRGVPVGVVRTGIEVTVLVGGWLLGGTVGVGTVLFSFGIGPLIHLLLPKLSLEPVPARQPA